MLRAWDSGFEMHLKPRRLVRAMADVAARLGVTIRWEQGQFHGGRCTVDGKDVVILNRRHPPEVQMVILADVLRTLPLNSIYIRPAIRDDINTLLAGD